MRIRIVAVGIFALGIVSILAMATLAQIPWADNSIHGCYDRVSKYLRLIDQDQRCLGTEASISWAQTGPPGSPGPTGTSGSPGGIGSAIISLVDFEYPREVMDDCTGASPPPGGPQSYVTVQAWTCAPMDANRQQMFATSINADDYPTSAMYEVEYRGFVLNDAGCVRLFDLTRNQPLEDTEVCIPAGAPDQLIPFVERKAWTLSAGEHELIVQGKGVMHLKKTLVRIKMQ